MRMNIRAGTLDFNPRRESMNGNVRESIISGTMDVEIPRYTECPRDVYLFLTGRGWGDMSNGDITLFSRPKSETLHTWEQAVAIEFYEFISLGGR